MVEGYVASGPLRYPLRADIRHAYAERAKLKARGDPAEVAYKLVLNSIYGKFAQSVGSARYHSLEWAGLITATTRARLNLAIDAAGDDAVVMVMTDGIWSRRPLPRRMLSTALGGWVRESESRLWLAEPGLYRTEGPDGARDYHRGYEAAVDIPGVLAAWHRKDFRAIPASPVRFIGMGAAVVINGVYRWREWRTCERVIEPVPIVGTTKRWPYTWDESFERPGFVPLAPLPRDEDVCSYPYEPSIIDEDFKRQLLEDECFEDPDDDRLPVGRR